MNVFIDEYARARKCSFRDQYILIHKHKFRAVYISDG